MTDTATPPRVAPTPVLLREPVRAYLYTVAGLIVAALVLAGWLTDEWSTFLLAAAAQLLAVPGVELARASVYSPRHLSLAARATERAIAVRTGNTRAAREIADRLDPIGRHAA